MSFPWYSSSMKSTSLENFPVNLKTIFSKNLSLWKTRVPQTWALKKWQIRKYFWNIVRMIYIWLFAPLSLSLTTTIAPFPLTLRFSLPTNQSHGAIHHSQVCQRHSPPMPPSSPLFTHRHRHFSPARTPPSSTPTIDFWFKYIYIYIYIFFFSVQWFSSLSSITGSTSTSTVVNWTTGS